MKILLITDRYKPNIGGLETTVDSIARILKRRGNQVVIIAARYPKNLKPCEIMNGLKVYRPFHLLRKRVSILLLPLFYFIDVMKMTKILKREKPDIVHANFMGNNMFYTILLKLILGFPLVITYHGNDVYEFPKSKIFRLVFKIISIKANHVTAMSADLLKAASKIVPQISRKSTVVRSGINLKDFDMKKKRPYKRRYIFSIGRHIHKKGFDLLIKAFSNIADKYNNIDLIIAGNGPEYRNYKKLIRDLKLEKRVKLTGRITDEERANYFYGCEFFVLPSRSEAFGLTNLEAMITGKAVVATAVEGVPELIKNNWNGILVKPNSESICNGMLYLLKNKKKMKSFGKNGRKFAQLLTWDKSTEGYLTVYKKVLYRD